MIQRWRKAWDLRCLILGLTVVGALAGTLQAADRNEGLDLLVLLDRSGSMEHLDSTGERAAERLRWLELLANRIAESARFDDLDHRISVISFGSEVRVELDWTPLRDSSPPLLRDRWEAIATGPTLGDTNFVVALDTAVERMRRLPSDPGRGRMAVLVTDGLPDETGLSEAAQLEAVQRLTSGPLGELGAVLEVILVGPARSAGRDRLTKAWEALSEVRIQRLAVDEGTALADLAGWIDRWVRVQRTTSAGSRGLEETIVVPPYLETVAFDVLSPGDASEVSLYAPGLPTRPVTPGPGIEERWIGDAIRTILIHRPAPGRWIFRKPNPQTQIEVFSRQFFPRGLLVRPAQDEQAFVDQSTTVLYRVLEGDDPFEPLSNYPVSLELAVVRPDGDWQHFDLPPAAFAGSAVYGSAREVIWEVPGHHQTRVKMRAMDLEGKPVDVFEDRWSGLTVRQPRKLACGLVESQQEAEIPLFGRFVFDHRPLELELQCHQKGSSASLESSEIASLSEALRPLLVHGDQTIEAEVRTAPDASGRLRVDLTGSRRAGEYELVLRVVDQALPPSLEVELADPRYRFSRVWTWGHRGQLALLVVLGIAVLLLFVGWSGSRLGSRRAWGNRPLAREEKRSKAATG